MKKQARILVLMTDAFGGHGGIAKFNQDLLSGLCEYPACDSVVGIPRLMSNEPEPYPPKLSYLTDGVGGKLKYVLAVINAVRSEAPFDLIICGHINLLPLAFLMRQWTRAPVILMMHGIDVWQPTRNALINYLANKVDAYISVSELTLGRFLDWSKVERLKSFVLPNSVDLNRFRPGPKKQDLVDRYDIAGKTVVMTLGRLDSEERRKGFDEMIAALPALQREVSGLVYMIVGDGPDRLRLQNKTKSLGVEDIVIFSGMISESEKVDHFRLADVFAMPSHGEGFGIVYLEAMACGIPVVASKLDGGREAVCHGELGILVDPADQDDIIRGINEALIRPRGVVPEGLDYFSLPNYTARLHQIMDVLLDTDLSQRRNLQ